ncbi:MAG: Uncharacterized oxidoreductase YrpG, partial [uncultured Blastococcus sp.]
GIHAPRPQWSVGLPALPGHHEFRLEDRGSAVARDHGPGPGRGGQLLRHRERLRVRRRQGPHRGGARQLVRPGRRAPGEDRAGHQGLRRHERLAQRHLPVRPQHRPRLRELAAPAADRLDRPLPVPPRRPPHAVGGDLAGVRDAGRPGEGALRRFLQPRGLADRGRQRGRRPPLLPGAGQRAVALQPAHPARRAGGAARRPALRRRHHPVEPARRRSAGRRPGEVGVREGCRPARRGAPAEADRAAPAGTGAVRGVLPGAGPRAGGRRPGLAAAPARGHGPDRRAAHDGAVRGRAGRAGPRSGRGRADPPRRDLPGLPAGSYGVRLV